MMMRRRGPGLIGTMARTAVIAGTATAVSGAVANKQHQAAVQQQAAQQQAAAEEQARIDAAATAAVAQQQPPAAAPAPAAGGDLMTQLQKLADMKAMGILTDEEFAAAKAKLLG